MDLDNFNIGKTKEMGDLEKKTTATEQT